MAYPHDAASILVYLGYPSDSYMAVEASPTEISIVWRGQEPAGVAAAVDAARLPMHRAKAHEAIAAERNRRVDEAVTANPTAWRGHIRTLADATALVLLVLSGQATPEQAADLTALLGMLAGIEQIETAAAAIDAEIDVVDASTIEAILAGVSTDIRWPI